MASRRRAFHEMSLGIAAGLGFSGNRHGRERQYCDRESDVLHEDLHWLVGGRLLPQRIPGKDFEFLSERKILMTDGATGSGYPIPRKSP